MPDSPRTINTIANVKPICHFGQNVSLELIMFQVRNLMNTQKASISRDRVRMGVHRAWFPDLAYLRYTRSAWINHDPARRLLAPRKPG